MISSKKLKPIRLFKLTQKELAIMSGQLMQQFVIMNQKQIPKYGVQMLLNPDISALIDHEPNSIAKNNT